MKRILLAMVLSLITTNVSAQLNDNQLYAAYCMGVLSGWNERYTQAINELGPERRVFAEELRNRHRELSRRYDRFRAYLFSSNPSMQALELLQVVKQRGLNEDAACTQGRNACSDSCKSRHHHDDLAALQCAMQCQSPTAAPRNPITCLSRVLVEPRR
jgi:hypothetical protein